MSVKITTKEICEGPLCGPLIRYAVPIIADGILQLLFNAADLVVVGQFGLKNSLGAMGATSSLTNLCVNLFMGLSVGVSVAVAQGIGSRDDARVRQTVHTAIPLALICGVILTVIGLAGAGTFLEWMGTPPEQIRLAALYMRIYFCGMIFNLLLNFGASILRAAGNTVEPMMYLTAAGGINVVLNLGFVILLKMDVAGVALATIISQAISAVLILRALMKRTDACRLCLRKIRIHRTALLQITKIGLPTGIQSSLFSISNVIIQSSVNSFGAVAIDGNTAAGNIESFLYTAMHAFSQTAMNFSGQNTGARNYPRIRRIYWLCVAIITVGASILGIGIYLCGEPLLSIYLPGSPEAVQYGLTRLSCICVTYFLCGLQEVAVGTVRGMGVSISPMIITVLGVCVFRIFWVFTVFQMPEYHTLTCLFLSYPISWIITFVAVSAVFFGVLRSRQKRLAA